jgi:hypothetical protein
MLKGMRDKNTILSSPLRFVENVFRVYSRLPIFTISLYDMTL